MTNLIVQLLGAILGFCGFVVVNFILVVYLTLRSVEGHLEKKEMYTLISVAALLCLGGLAFYYIGSII